ncbi:MAG: NAD(P)/FAD-dependent oxidoreductase [Acidobacteria bacterium]|nr:NAD(P)/FAD-dependent oxidoreductase [Acidobacteriota bacterium]
MSQPHHAVIIGGGFGGLNAAKALAALPVQVTLIDRRNFHLFQPLLYQVASGGLSPGDIAAPLRTVLNQYPNVQVLLGEVTAIDAVARTVTVCGNPAPYDTLVVAAGAENFYFGNADWAEHAPALKTVEDATEIRSRILTAFEAAEREPDRDKRLAWLRFVVVGGGPTGVELSGAIAEISRDTMRADFRRIRPEESQIILLDGSDRILPSFEPDLSEKAARYLIRLGVLPRTGVRVTSIDAEGVALTSPKGTERIGSRTVLWAAGVRSSALGGILARQTGVELDRGGRVPIGADLSIAGHPEIFVIGDLARFEQDGQPLAGVAPVAMQQGTHLGRVLRDRFAGRTPPPFRYVDRGIMAVIGRHAAVADIGGVRFGGHLAWLAWLFLHLFMLVGYQNRVLVAIRWAFQYFTYSRGARLITPGRV